jgi:Cdc6-like AAA superfamily ATPase
MAGESRSNIPPNSSILVGREKVIAKIEEALATSAINVVAIYGMGGIGKTALAHFVAERQRDSNRFPGGVIWIDCKLDNSLPQILMTITLTLGVESPSLSSGTLRDSVVSHLQSAPTLLIFDNY